MKRLYILSLLSLLLFSCESSDILDNSEELASTTPISISVSQNTLTRGTLAESESAMGTIGLYCEYSEQGYWTTSAKYDKMKNICYTYSNSSWSSSTTYTWGHSSITDKFSFNAYSPFADDKNGISPSIIDGELSISFSMPTKCEEQPDLMIASPRKDIYPQIGGNVYLEFEHALSAIGFKVKGESTMKLLSVTLGGISSDGVLTHDGTSCVWSSSESDDTTESTDKTFLAGITATSPTSEDQATLVTNSDGYIMTVPQEPTSAYVLITYCSTGDETLILSETLQIPTDTNWEISHQYLYTITLAESLKIEIDSWGEFNSDDVIEDEDGYKVDDYGDSSDSDDNIVDEDGYDIDDYEGSSTSDDKIVDENGYDIDGYEGSSTSDDKIVDENGYDIDGYEGSSTSDDTIEDENGFITSDDYDDTSNSEDIIKDEDGLSSDDYDKTITSGDTITGSAASETN